MRISALALVVALQASASAPMQGQFVVEPMRVGPVAIGTPVQTVYDSFRDRVRLIDLKLEGMFAPALEVRLFGSQLAPSLVAEIGASGNQMVVSRISVLDTALRTKDGIGVGSTLGELRARHTIAWVSHEEGCGCVRVEALKMTFPLEFRGRDSLRSVRDPAKLPADLRIIGIMLTGGDHFPAP